MKRQVDLKEISDGKLYGPNDMVRADCGDCEGCFACCTNMGSSIILDPLDLHRMRIGLGMDFVQLMAQEKIELQVVDGIILPNLKMEERQNVCPFLNRKGRCSIHPFRPGLCRLFPLGRYYEGDGFRYFLQVRECKKENRSKVKVRKWVDTPDLKRYEAFILSWHFFLKEAEVLLSHEDEAFVREFQLFFLKHFYITPYEEEKDFYEQFQNRLEKGKVYGKASK